MNNGNLDGALATARKIDSSHSLDDTRTFIAIAQSLESAGKTTESDAVYREAIETFGDSRAPIELIAQTRFRAGDYADAIESLRHPYHYQYYLLSEGILEWLLIALNRASPSDAKLIADLWREKLPDARAEERVGFRAEKLAVIAAVLAKAARVQSVARR